MEKIIVEKRLGIKPDYQYKAIRSKFFPQANWHKNKITAIKNLLNISKDKRILDIGTGSGNLEFEIANDVHEIIGIDYNDEAIAFLDQKLNELAIKNVKLFIKDLKEIENLNIPKADHIIMIDVIEHIAIDDAAILVSKFKNLLNPNGEVLIITPNYKSLWIYLEKILDKVSVLPKFDGEQHLSKFHKDNLPQMFDEAGFDTLNLTSFNTFSYLFPSRRLSKYLCIAELKSKFPYGNLIVGHFKLR
jgi:2-polyprenyl-3-methyl-5-hydroxy-6-metoxy-1,4-benzoquinol methylase